MAELVAQITLFQPSQMQGKSPFVKAYGICLPEHASIVLDKHNANAMRAQHHVMGKQKTTA